MMEIWADSTGVRLVPEPSLSPFRSEEVGRGEEAEGPGKGRGPSSGAQTMEVPPTQGAACSSVILTSTRRRGTGSWQPGGTQMDAFLPSQALSAGCLSQNQVLSTCSMPDT